MLYSTTDLFLHVIQGPKTFTCVLTLRVILLYSSLASLALIFSRRATSSGFCSKLPTSHYKQLIKFKKGSKNSTDLHIYSYKWTKQSVTILEAAACAAVQLYRR